MITEVKEVHVPLRGLEAQDPIQTEFLCSRLDKLFLSFSPLSSQLCPPINTISSPSPRHLENLADCSTWVFFFEPLMHSLLFHIDQVSGFILLRVRVIIFCMSLFSLTNFHSFYITKAGSELSIN